MERNKACILCTNDMYRCRYSVGWNTPYIYAKSHASPSGSHAILLFLTLPLADNLTVGAPQIGNNKAIQVLLTPMVSPPSPRHLHLPLKEDLGWLGRMTSVSEAIVS